MSLSGKAEWTDGSFLVSAAATWLLSACILLTAAALLANLLDFGEQGLGLLSSCVSFLCAAAAGHATAKKKKGKAFLTALLIATALVILLLTIGFLIRGTAMDASSILSLVSFTYAGVLFGVLILCHPGRAPKRARPRV